MSSQVCPSFQGDKKEVYNISPHLRGDLQKSPYWSLENLALEASEDRGVPTSGPFYKNRLRLQGQGIKPPVHRRGVVPSESIQIVWCWPPEKPTQDLVEFLKDVKFWGTKHDSVPGVPVVRGEGVCRSYPSLFPATARPPSPGQG